MEKQFLPTTKDEMLSRGWKEVDFVFVCGDAYVDLPSFGMAIISRLLEAHGYKVGIITQPNWKDKNSIDVFGKPKLGFLVSAGNMDSMVNHYSVSKKKRDNDAYTPGGIMGKRPNYAAVVYGNLIRQTYKDVPIILGGLEASLRRLAHYDYWSDRLKRSILLDSDGDIVVCGMGEKAIIEIADSLANGIQVCDLTYIDGTVVKVSNMDSIYDYIALPSYKELKKDKTKYAESFRVQYENTDPYNGERLVEPYSDSLYVVQNPPAKPLSQLEMDNLYGLPYMREVHPNELKKGQVAAIEEVKYSLASNRGCFGGCNFCCLTFHQGRIVQARSHDSIIKEAMEMVEDPKFKGYIHDVGGPTANFRQPSCEKQLRVGVCKKRQCLFPKPCKNLKVDHQDYVSLLRKLRNIQGIKKVFIRSGVRFDYVNLDKDKTFLRELCEHHISGQLRVAPEHISNSVLAKMGKPSHEEYVKFVNDFNFANKKLKKEQYIAPYLMSSHPGSTLADGIELGLYCRDLGYNPRQVQDFYPTPSTMATVMYYTEIDPRTMKKVYVAKSARDKVLQRVLIQYRNPANHSLVLEALKKAGREDLIGFGKDCLVAPRVIKSVGYSGGKGSSKKDSRDKKDTKIKDNVKIGKKQGRKW